VAIEVNALHATGFDATGAAGGDFFVPPGAAAGAAAALAIDGAVIADSGLVAASGTGSIGDNQIARAIAGLRDTRIVNGGTATPTEAWGQFAYRVGADLRSARTSNAVREQVRLQLEQLRAQVSGVSLDEEAANLMRFQRAYEANARYFTTISDTLDTLINMVRP
jgi:flagellar hook-associated protein 1 FlgK